MGEVAELFQWLPADRAAELAREDPLRRRAGEELADVLLYLVRLADVLDVDLGAVATSKLADSAERFDADDFRGRAPQKR